MNSGVLKAKLGNAQIASVDTRIQPLSYILLHYNLDYVAEWVLSAEFGSQDTTSLRRQAQVSPCHSGGDPILYFHGNMNFLSKHSPEMKSGCDPHSKLQELIHR